jgi:hypothetical protein
MKIQNVTIWLACLLFCLTARVCSADDVPHPILSISGSGSGASTVLSAWTESQYTNDFIPHSPPRNSAQGFAPAVVSGDTGWSWSSSTPNQITSTPSGTVFPNANPAYPVQTQAVTVFLTTATNNLTKSVNAIYYNKAGSTTAKSLVFNLIDYYKLNQLRSDLNKLAPAYLNSGSTPATRNDNYARRIAVALLDWARWHPSYYLTAINSSSFINVTPNYLATTTGFGPQRASDHNGLAHEWQVDELKAFDAIYDSVALTNMNAEFGFDVRQYICDDLFFDEGDFLVNHIPVDIAIQSNLSAPYAILPQVARVLDRPDYITWMDSYLDATVQKKIRRDGALEEGEGYSIGYLNANQDAAQNTHDYFLTRAATNSLLLAISNRATIYNATLAYGQGQWSTVSLPSGQLASFGDTPFNNYFSAHSDGHSALLPAYGTLAIGAGSGSQAVQVNQNFSGDNNHMRADMNAFVLWAFNNEYLGNIRYYNGSIGRNFGEQMLAYNTITIDRANLTPYPDADTYGNGNLTLYEPGDNGLAVTELDGQRAYSSKASRFQRLLLLNTVDLAKPYIVDVFRVAGGTTHDYTFHGSVRWDQNGQCSFPLVTNSNPYPMLEGSETWNSSADTPYYGFWRNVNSNTAPGNFQITYADTSRASGRDVKLWMTADPNTYTIYLGTTPVPARDNTVPTNFFDSMNLTRPSAIIRHRVTSGPLQDLFVSVIEPMNAGVSNIVSVERLPMSGSSLESCGIKVTFKDGRSDTYIVNLRNPKIAGANTGSATVSTLDGQYSLTGRVGFYSTNSAGASAWVVNGNHFQYPGGSYSPTNLYYAGGIAGSTRKQDGAAYDAFTTTTPLPTGTALRNKYLSLTHGTLSGSGTTNISEMYRIDQVVLSNGFYYICFTNDTDLEINNVLAVSGSGSDIWGTSDQFNYDYQPVSGDQTITAKVVSQDNTSSWAKAGVMFRETTANNSSYVGLYVTPGNGVSMQYRDGTGTSAVDLERQTGLTAPYWVRLVRSGNAFAGYSSPDGVSWTQVGQTNVSMTTVVTAGLAVTAHNSGTLNTATFDQLNLSGPLTDTDIGATGGSAGYYTVSTEQVAPLRTFTGSNTFEIAMSSSQPALLPGAPTGLKAIAGNSQIFLTWNAPFGATSFNVKRATVSGGPYCVIANPVTTFFTDVNVTNDRAYYYTVSATNAIGESADSAQAKAIPFANASTNLVAHLTFDDGTADDSSGYENNGVLNGGATIVTDSQRGKVLSLDGSSGYVDLGNATSLDLSDHSQATITAWVKLAVTHNHNTILSKGEWKQAYSLLIKGDSAPANELWTGNDTSVFSSDVISLNEWTHVAVVINGSLTTFYINGQTSGAINQDRGNPIDQTTTDVCLGREQYSGSLPSGRWFFNGEMDDIRIYQQALTQTEIQKAMSNVVDNAPAFANHPLNGFIANAGKSYIGSLLGTASDPDSGDTLSFSKINAPTWLNVGANGSLSGTPSAANAGTNSFQLRVSDSNGFFDETTLNIFVNPASPQFTSTTLSGTNLIFSGTNGVPGWTYQVLSATDLSSPWSNWTVVGTNKFDENGNFTFTNSIHENNSQMFYLLMFQ